MLELYWQCWLFRAILLPLATFIQRTDRLIKVQLTLPHWRQILTCCRLLTSRLSSSLPLSFLQVSTLSVLSATHCVFFFSGQQSSSCTVYYLPINQASNMKSFVITMINVPSVHQCPVTGTTASDDGEHGNSNSFHSCPQLALDSSPELTQLTFVRGEHTQYLLINLQLPLRLECSQSSCLSLQKEVGRIREGSHDLMAV